MPTHSIRCLLDEAEQLGLPMNLGKRTPTQRSAYAMLGLNEPEDVDPRWSKGREPARQARNANVTTFLDILKLKLLKHDNREIDKEKKRSRGLNMNIYRLGHLMGAFDKVEKDVKRYHLVGSDEALGALKKSLLKRFTSHGGRSSFRPAAAVIKKIDKFMKDGKKPSTR